MIEGDKSVRTFLRIVIYCKCEEFTFGKRII